MSKLQLLDLFAGIGGFSLGLERTGGFETAAFCEIDPDAQKVLRKHWPEVPIYEDIRDITAASLARDGIYPTAISGGFPCQDISTAGHQKGIDAERSGLWSELCRIIGDVRPAVAFVENVSNLLSGPSEQPGGWFGRVLGDLASIGYDAEWHSIQAAHLGAPHLRDRVWVIAYPQHSDTNSSRPHRAQMHQHGSAQPGDKQERELGSFCAVLAHPTCQRCGEARTDSQRQTEWTASGCDVSDANQLHVEGIKRRSADQEIGKEPRERQARPQASISGGIRNTQPQLGRGFNGISSWLDGSWEHGIARTHKRQKSDKYRLQQLGNAIVPEHAYLLGCAYLDSIGWRDAA